MKTATKHENDEFLVISFQHVSGRKVTVNRPRTPKQWAIAHENVHETRKQRVSGHIFPTCIRSEGHFNRPRTPKLWAIAHENSHKTRERRVSGHIFPTCIRSKGHCKSP